jgi:hypothetical protein
MNNSFWLENPNILFKSDQLSNIWPMVDMTFENKLNAISRLVIILIILGYLFTKNNKVLLSGLLSLGAIVLLYKMKKLKKIKKDLGDNFNFEQSMHAWHPMPNTMVENDQKSFAEFCYGDMIACRDEENNEIACVRNMPPRWTNY